MSMNGVGVAFFADLVKLLAHRFGDRGLDQQEFNDLIHLAGEIERLWRAAGEGEKREVPGGKA